MSEVKSPPQSLKDKVDLERLENMAIQDIQDLYESFKKLNNAIINKEVSLSSISFEDHKKSQAGIILDALHNLGANKVASEMKRFGMKVRPCLKGTIEMSDLALAANFLILASKPSNLIEVMKYKELAKCIFAFEESITLMKTYTRPKNLTDNLVKPGDKGTKWADITNQINKLSENIVGNITD